MIDMDYPGKYHELLLIEIVNGKYLACYHAELALYSGQALNIGAEQNSEFLM